MLEIVSEISVFKPLNLLVGFFNLFLLPYYVFQQHKAWRYF